MYDFYWSDEEQMFKVYDIDTGVTVYLADTYTDAEDVCFEMNNH